MEAQDGRALLGDQERRWDGCSEWSVRVRFPPSATPMPDPPATGGPDDPERLRQARRAAVADRALRDEMVLQFDAALRALADAARTSYAHGPAALSASYLLPDSLTEPFARCVASYAAELASWAADVSLDGPFRPSEADWTATCGASPDCRGRSSTGGVDERLRPPRPT